MFEKILAKFTCLFFGCIDGGNYDFFPKDNSYLIYKCPRCEKEHHLR